MFERGLFKDLLLRALNGGMSSVAVYWLLNQPFMEGVVKALERFSANLTATASQVKRFMAIAVATLISLGLYGLTVLAGWAVFPMDWVGWCDLVIWLGGLAFTGSQAVHGFRDLGPEND